MLIHSNLPMTTQALQVARKFATYMAHDPPGTIIQEGSLSFLLQRPGVLLLIQPSEEYMLRRSATDIHLGIDESIFAFTISDKEDQMIRYVADRSRFHAVTRVSTYLAVSHPTWRITKVDKISKSRGLGGD
jgi:hypothetical protein